MHVIIFDVDGTLTQSTSVDAQCFERAIVETLGIRIDTDWATYRHQTDTGILSEVLERCGLSVNPSRLAAVRSRFVELLGATLQADPTACLPSPGAHALLEDLCELPNVAVGIATGGWAESARMKLRHTGILLNRVAFASSDDSASRQDIIRAALRRVTERTKCDFETATYVGDAPWDVRAARELGIEFVGVASTAVDKARLVAAGAPIVITSLADIRAFWPSGKEVAET